jgi:hypothetical protein
MTSAGVAIAGAVSTGGLTALAAKVLHRKKTQESKDSKAKEQGR